uniref:Ice-binding protein C-terminal domain-containing protein n=1 Tax=Solibacter usitatus (strain Ellin6076) TaxID=234267 RepID=Q01T41_SOLUE
MKFPHLRHHIVPCMVLATMIFANAKIAKAIAITPAGAALGFSVSTFVSGFGVAGFGVGPLGVAVESNGNVLVDASNLNQNYVFSDTDGQTLAGAISHTSFVSFPPAYATANNNGVLGATYGSQNNSLVKFNADGTVNTLYSNSSGTTSGLVITNGMWANPTNGHILATGGGRIYDIDVSGAAPTFRIVTNASPDGISVSPDGTIVYGATGNVVGWNIATGAQVLSISVGNSPDGMGVISSSNSLNGDIIVNGNNGTIVLIDVHNSNALITIANGGTRGDYTSPDPTNGSLFVTQSNEIDRLTCGAGCGIGAPPPPPPDGTPEPASLFMFGGGLAGLAFLRFRK